MKELLQLLKQLSPDDGELIARAKGKYQLTGNFFKDVVKVVRNGKENSI